MRRISWNRFFSRLVSTALLSAWLVAGFASVTQAAPAPAEAFVDSDIRAGLAILQNGALSPGQRDSQFQSFLLGVTDLRRIALFTLGSYAASASPGDQDAFVAAFRNYALAVYRSYFQMYAGQTLRVTGSQARSADDVIVSTVMADPSGGVPMKIDFRVRLGGDRPVVTDIGIAGVWLALAQRDDFAGFLGQHKGDVAALTAHLNDVALTYLQK